MLKHYVEFLYPCISGCGTLVREISERDISKVDIPADCFVFRFFDRRETVEDGETLMGERKNISGVQYLGEIITLEQAKAAYWNDDKYNILIENMEQNPSAAVVLKTKSGRFIPIGEFVKSI